MDHPLQRFTSGLRSRLPAWLGGQVSQTAAVPETVWPLADALQCNRELSGNFAPDPLPAGDARFVARAAELATLSTIIERWQSGHAVMAAVTGPQGCGITSLLNQVTTLLAADTVCQGEQLGARLRNQADVLELMARLFDLHTTPESPSDLIDQINTAAPRVLILDNAHFLAFRVMGARTAARSPGAIMVATQLRHLWIMGCRQQAWRRMMYMHQVEHFFTDVLDWNTSAPSSLAK
jgi:hypothetical protein